MALHQVLGMEEHEMESLDQTSGLTGYHPAHAAMKHDSQKVG